MRKPENARHADLRQGHEFGARRRRGVSRELPTPQQLLVAPQRRLSRWRRSCDSNSAGTVLSLQLAQQRGISIWRVRRTLTRQRKRRFLLHMYRREAGMLGLTERVNLGPETTRPATKQDIRTAREIAKRKGDL